MCDRRSAPRESFVEQPADASLDLVADLPDVRDGSPGRIRQLPVQVALAGYERALIPAAHRHDDVRRADVAIGPRARPGGADVDADLGHDGHGHRVDSVARAGAARANLDTIAAELTGEPGGHLRPARVVDAEEQDHGTLVRHDLSSSR
jgi:hypothetical protein